MQTTLEGINLHLLQEGSIYVDYLKFFREAAFSRKYLFAAFSVGLLGFLFGFKKRFA